MDEKNDLIKVGKYDLRYNELLSIDIEETPPVGRMRPMRSSLTKKARSMRIMPITGPGTGMPALRLMTSPTT